MDLFSPMRTTLTKLYLYKNDLKEINEKTFQGMSKLIELQLSYNKLAKIDCWFKGLEKLEYLNLSTNIIIDIIFKKK